MSTISVKLAATLLLISLMSGWSSVVSSASSISLQAAVYFDNSLVGLGSFVGLNVMKQKLPRWKEHEQAKIFVTAGLTEHDHPIDPPFIDLLFKLSIVHGGVHVGGEDVVVGPQIVVQVRSPVLGVRGRVDDGPDVHGGMAQSEALIVQNLDSPRSAWKEEKSQFHPGNGWNSPSSARENMIWAE